MKKKAPKKIAALVRAEYGVGSQPGGAMASVYSGGFPFRAA